MSWTDQRARAALRAMFDAGVASADPRIVLAARLPEPPLGRTVVVGAGKSAALMAAALEAAITLCVGEATVKHVHAIRTATRRLEAQMVMLDLLPEVPGHRKPAKKLRQRLASLRRAAGKVRDLDVLRDKLHDPEEEPELWRDTEGEARSHESRKLQGRFSKRRDKAAESLGALLTESQGKVARALEDLQDALAPAEDLSLQAAHLLELAQAWFATQMTHLGASRDEEAMHDARKAAKLVRYVLEALPKSAEGRQQAERFKDLQQAGGHWHDLLLLAQEARRGLGKKSELALRAAHLRDTALDRYAAALTSFEGVAKAGS